MSKGKHIEKGESKMEKRYNSKIEYMGEVVEEVCMNCLTVLVAAAVVGSFLLLIIK